VRQQALGAAGEEPPSWGVSGVWDPELVPKDPAGNRTAEQIDDAVTGASYNNMNQLVSQQAGGALVFKGTVSEPANVTVGGKPATVTADNQFEGQAVVPSGTGQVVVAATDPSGNLRTNTYEVAQDATSKTFTYDANGNMTSDGTRTYEWDAENRLVAVKEGANTIASYSYGAQKLRMSKTAAGQTWSYVYDDSQNVVEVRLGSGTVQRYMHGSGIDEPLGVVAGGVASYFTADHLGSVISTTDSAGNATLRRQYDPWGNLLAGQADGGPAFTGKEWDPEAGLYYYRARYLDPTSGRFLSEDPVGRIGGPNLYAYVRNAPLLWRDPMGLWRVKGFPGNWGDDVNAAAKLVDTMLSSCCVPPGLQADLQKKLHDDRLTFVYTPDLPDCGNTPKEVASERYDSLKEWPIEISSRPWTSFCCSNPMAAPSMELGAVLIHELVHIGRPLSWHVGKYKGRDGVLPFKVAYDCFGCERPEYEPKK
jgi:RHS repeat-associated protein